MSALAGIYHWDGAPVSDEDLAVLAAHSRAAGPHGGGTVTPAQGMALQAHLLRFDRHSAGERQPCVFAQGSVLTWDGRLDNREDLLLELHHTLGPDQSDAVLVAAAYTRWGLDCLPRLLGDWSLALWDAERQTLILARDYMGNRPLHYLETCRGIAWATCLDALAACFNLYAHPDEGYIAARLTFGVPPDLTPFRGARALRAGHVLTATRAGGITVRRYWTFTPATIRYRDPRDYTDRLRQLLTEAVRVRLRAERTVWAQLSGGWDSSSVVCLAHALVQRGCVETPALQPVTSNTSHAPESDEHSLVAAVERWCGFQTVSCESRHYQPFADMLGHPRPVSVGPYTSVVGPIERSGDQVVLGGEPGDIVMMADACHRLALLEPLHEGHPIRTLRLCAARARRFRRAVLATMFNVAWEAYFPPYRFDRVRRRNLRERARQTGGGSCDLATIFGVTPALLGRVPELRPYTPSVVDFPVVKRYMVTALYRYADSVSENGDRVPAVWETLPYTHRPLVEFMLAVPLLSFWDPVVHRDGMKRALADILPPQILAGSAKATNPGSVTQEASRRRRVEELTAARSIIGPAKDWELVTRGYLDPTTLTQALSEFQAASATTRISSGDALIFTRLSLEAWLRTLAALPGHVAASRPASQPVTSAAGPPMGMLGPNLRA